jgi:hypothetical protein
MKPKKPSFQKITIPEVPEVAAERVRLAEVRPSLNQKVPAPDSYYYDFSLRYLLDNSPPPFKVPSFFAEQDLGTQMLPKALPGQAPAGGVQFVALDDVEKQSKEIAVLEGGFTALRFLMEMATGPRPDFFDPWAASIREYTQEYRRHQEGILILDTHIPGSSYRHLRVMDHHGLHFTPDGKNATMKLLDLFEETLGKVQKDWFAQLDGIRGMILDPQLGEAAHWDPVIAAAIVDLNIKKATTDNLADGGEALWISRHQGEVLRELKNGGDLPELLRRSTEFIDFTAFGNNYDRSDEAVELGAALLYSYGGILKRHGIQGSDRFSGEKAATLMHEATSLVDGMIRNPQARSFAAKAFWAEVDKAKAVAGGAVTGEGTVNGRQVLAFYDVTKPVEIIDGQGKIETHRLSDFSIFAQWLSVPELQRGKPVSEKLPLQVTVAPMAPLPRDGYNPVSRSLPIIAVPNGLKSQNPKGLLAILDALNEAEAKKARELGVGANFWFGKDNVVLPNPAGGGSLLSLYEIRSVVMDPSHGLLGNELTLDLRKDVPPGGEIKIGNVTLKHKVKGGYFAEAEPQSNFRFRESGSQGSELIEGRKTSEPSGFIGTLLYHGDTLTLAGGGVIRIVDSKHGPALKARRRPSWEK